MSSDLFECWPQGHASGGGVKVGSAGRDLDFICQQPTDDSLPSPIVQRATVHHVKSGRAQGEVVLLHFDDGGHLSYRLEADDDGGFRFVLGGDILTRTLLADVERREAFKMSG